MLLIIEGVGCFVFTDISQTLFRQVFGCCIDKINHCSGIVLAVTSVLGGSNTNIDQLRQVNNYQGLVIIP